MGVISKVDGKDVGIKGNKRTDSKLEFEEWEDSLVPEAIIVS